MSEQLFFQNYLVAFLDLVGQREALRKMSKLPGTPAEINAFIQIARESLGKVLDMRQGFGNFLNAAKQEKLDLSQFPAEHRANIQAARQIECSMYGLSDAIVISVPLGGSDEHCKATNGVKIALLAVCSLAVLALGGKIAFRGGVEVGIATMLDAGEVYGPALARAYSLESEMAEYPRIVVGNGLLHFLEAVTRQEPQSPFGRIAQQNAVKCRRMIVQDTDGRQMLDFLGREVRESPGASLLSDLVMPGHDFVMSEYEKFQRAGNDKLASRYYRLLSYYDARKKLWGV